MALPTYLDPNKNLMLMQNQWKSQLDPVLANATTNLSILTNVPIATGINVINHKLGQQMQGWFITDINAAITLFRSQPFNKLTITLTSSGPAIINLAVF